MSEEEVEDLNSWYEKSDLYLKNIKSFVENCVALNKTGSHLGDEERQKPNRVNIVAVIDH